MSVTVIEKNQINFKIALLPFWSLKKISGSGDFRPSFTPVFPEWGWSKSKSIVISHFSIDLTNSDVVSSFVSQAKGVPSHGGGGGWDKDFLFSGFFDQDQPMRIDVHLLRPNIFGQVDLVSPLVWIEILRLDDDNWDRQWQDILSSDQSINRSGWGSTTFLGQYPIFFRRWQKRPPIFILDQSTRCDDIHNEGESDREKTKKEKLSNISFQGDSLSLAFISGQSEAVLVR